MKYKRKTTKAFMLASTLMLVSMIVLPMSVSAAGIVDRSGGLGDLFLLDKLFNTGSNFLTSGKTNLGDLFILDKLFPVQTATAQTQSLASQLKGRILIQTEANGAAWYVDPVSLKRASLGDPSNAFKTMSNYAVGITNADFDALSKSVPTSLRGRFVIKTQDAGRMYYVKPAGDGVVYVGGPKDALNLIKSVGLGITNSNIAKITEA